MGISHVERKYLGLAGTGHQCDSHSQDRKLAVSPLSKGVPFSHCKGPEVSGAMSVG